MSKGVFVQKSVVPSVVRRIDVDALHSLAISWFQRTKRGIVVGVNQFTAKRGLDVVKTGQDSSLEIGAEMAAR